MSALRAPAPPAAALAAALRGERELIDRLTEVLARQRRAVALNDLSALEDTAFAAHRILPNLTQAQRRRRSLVQLALGRPEGDLSLGALREALRQAPRPAPPDDDGTGDDAELDAAIDGLQDAAARLSDELRINRGVLEGALAAGDRLIRALGGTGRAPTVYRRAEEAPGPVAGGRLVDRQV